MTIRIYNQKNYHVLAYLYDDRAYGSGHQGCFEIFLEADFYILDKSHLPCTGLNLISCQHTVSSASSASYRIWYGMQMTCTDPGPLTGFTGQKPGDLRNATSDASSPVSIDADAHVLVTIRATEASTPPS